MIRRLVRAVAGRGQAVARAVSDRFRQATAGSAAQARLDRIDADADRMCKGVEDLQRMTADVGKEAKSAAHEVERLAYMLQRPDVSPRDRPELERRLEFFRMRMHEAEARYASCRDGLRAARDNVDRVRAEAALARVDAAMLNVPLVDRTSEDVRRASDVYLSTGRVQSLCKPTANLAVLLAAPGLPPDIAGTVRRLLLERTPPKVDVTVWPNVRELVEWGKANDPDFYKALCSNLHIAHTWHVILAQACDPNNSAAQLFRIVAARCAPSSRPDWVRVVRRTLDDMERDMALTHDHRTSTVRDLARRVAEDPALAPILADAVEDAGYGGAALARLRGGDPPGPGSYLIRFLIFGG